MKKRCSPWDIYRVWREFGPAVLVKRRGGALATRAFAGLAILVALATATAGVLSAGADPGSSVLIYPARLEMSIESGRKGTGLINVVNQAKTPAPLETMLLDWEMNPGGKPIPHDPGTLPSSLQAWLKFNPRLFDVPPGANQAVRFTIAVPPGTPPGERRALISLAARTQGEGAAVRPQVWVVIYVAVPPVTRQLRLNRLLLRRDGGAAALVAEMACPGNAHVRAKGSAILLDRKGAAAAKLLVAERVFLPGLPAELVIPLTEGQLAPGAYRARLELTDNLDQPVLRGEAEVIL